MYYELNYLQRDVFFYGIISPKYFHYLQMCQDCVTQPLAHAFMRQAHVLPYKERGAYYYVMNATFVADDFSQFSESVGETFRSLKIRKQSKKTQATRTLAMTAVQEGK